jgi:DNA-binding NarL/FixJ family response regulator
VKHVLIVEDHPLVAEATADLLMARHRELAVHVAGDAAGAIESLDSGMDWHRVLLDLDVPGAFGLSLVREVACRGWAARCCVISATQRPEFIREARSLGLLGYIAKAMPVDEFARRLDRVLEGGFSYQEAESSRRLPASALTRRQIELLSLASEGLSSKHISRVVGITEGSINNHFNAMMRALDVSNRTHAVARGIELGLIPARRASPAPAPCVRSATSVQAEEV